MLPLGSLHVSGAPLSPATVENLAKVGVTLPTESKTFALVYFETSWVTLKNPWAPAPLAWTTLSGILYRSKWASLSMRWKSEIATGPYSPAVTEFWLSSTGCPVDVVRTFGNDININISNHLNLFSISILSLTFISFQSLYSRKRPKYRWRWSISIQQSYPEILVGISSMKSWDFILVPD